MFTRGAYQAASTELSSSKMCGNIAANRIPNRFKNKQKSAVAGQFNILNNILTLTHCLGSVIMAF
jgi:uncharacterized protein YejL (UPF0352 family)